jgi:hypothetical protein
MRELTTHQVKGAQGDGTRIFVLDGPGQGGACHRYAVGEFIYEPDEALASEAAEDALCFVGFQNGPIKEHGVNGVQNEHLLAIVVDRLECFQAGPFASEENDEALQHVRDALERLQKRTRDRIARGVEGHDKP